VVQTRLTNPLKRFTILFRDFVCFKALRTVAGRARALAPSCLTCGSLSSIHGWPALHGDAPAAAEEELHGRHVATFGRLPKYTKRK
jgi:hypothetical protein